LSYELREDDELFLESIGLGFDRVRGIISGTPHSIPETGTNILVTCIEDIDDIDDSNPDVPKTVSEFFYIRINDFSILTYGGVGCAGEDFYTTIRLCGGQAPFLWEIASDSIEDEDLTYDDFTINPWNTLTVTLPILYERTYPHFTVTVHDDLGDTDFKEFDIMVNPFVEEDADVPLPAITNPQLLPYATVGEPYPPYQLETCLSSDRLGALIPEGYCTFQWGLDPESSALPDGLELSLGGEISGTPEVAGLFPFEARFGCIDLDAEDPEVLWLGCGLFVIRVLETDELLNYTRRAVDLTECGAYHDYDINSIVLTGGIGEPYWEVEDGREIIPGVLLISDGSLTGQPAMPGEYHAHVQVYDESRGTDGLEFDLQINVGTGDSDNLQILHMRQWPAGDPDHPANTLFLDFAPDEERELEVDFEFSDLVDEAAWRGFRTRQVTLWRVGECASGTTARTIVEGDVDDDPEDEYIAYFSHADFLGLVSEPGDYSFRIVLQHLDDPSQPGGVTNWLQSRISGITVEPEPE
jgi:hypothetical protein